MQLAAPGPEQAVRIEAGEGYYRACFEAMASDCEVLCETTDAAEAAELGRIAAAETWRIERKFSRYRADSAVSRINRAAGRTFEVDAETAKLIDFSSKLFQLSDGLFDITAGVLRRAWSFDGGQAVPSPEVVQALLPYVGWHRCDWERPAFRLQTGMEIDLGGIGKEYAVDRAAALLRGHTGKSCLVNLGGDLAVTGAPMTFRHWRVGIEAVRAADTVPSRLLRLRTGGLATSGDARRFVEQDGRRYGHILDPRSGWPVENAPRSVTVAADTCTQAGMFATLAMLQGEGAEAFLDAQNVSYWCAR